MPQGRLKLVISKTPKHDVEIVIEENEGKKAYGQLKQLVGGTLDDVQWKEDEASQ